ncbi:MAG: superoxide dismutase family protein [Rhodobacterales bacterium]
MTRFFATLAALSLAGAATAQTEETAQNGAPLYASFVDGEGQPNGSASLSQTNSGVLIEIEVQGLPAESWVAFHVHEGGTCNHEDGHESAEGHFNPGGAEHGFLPDGGPHAGDMPNQYVPESGVLRAQVLNTFVSLEDGDTDIRGRTLMIHAEPDDYQSQPSGDAGDRIACAVIE